MRQATTTQTTAHEQEGGRWDIDSFYELWGPPCQRYLFSFPNWFLARCNDVNLGAMGGKQGCEGRQRKGSTDRGRPG